jgi:BirA family transcriptional regulator, biotin operon repressor / biotin---[acetyl-CoA-carboxylase] ligase
LSALAVTKASPSTNSDLIAALAVEPGEWPHMSALVADHQTAGRGRAGREWLTPKGAALTVSYVLRPRLPRERWGIVPLVMGLAAVNTMRSMGIDASLKWPNDVVVDCTGESASESGSESKSGTQGDIAGWGPLRKIAGILCEVSDDAVVAGIGINVSQTRAELPVPHAASMATVGSRQLDRGLLLDALSQEVAAQVDNAERDPDAFVAEVAAVTCTLGRQILVERAGAPPLTGIAEGIGADGSLLVRTSAGEPVEVTAGDVRLRGA